MAELSASSQKILNDTRTYPGYVVSNDQVANHIVQSATARGIDPNVALAVYSSEGRTNYQSQVPNANSPNGYEQSYGPYQLYNKGLGAQFQQETGLSASDPTTWKQNVDFSMNYASKNGWSPWYGFNNTTYASQGKYAGIGSEAGPVPVPASYIPGGNANPDTPIPDARPTSSVYNNSVTFDDNGAVRRGEFNNTPDMPSDPKDTSGGSLSLSNTVNGFTNNSGLLFSTDSSAAVKGGVSLSSFIPGGVDALASTAPTTIVGSTTTSADQLPQTLVQNPLSEYDSYTYGITLLTMEQNAFNSLASSTVSSNTIPAILATPISSSGVGLVLISSGGRSGANFPRNPSFANTDFFFDEVKLTTYVNTDKTNKDSNVIEGSMTIIEPNAFTLIERLRAAVGSVGGSDYIRHPYILRIDFFGYKTDASGNGSVGLIPNQTKFIPITLVDMQIQQTSSGTEYSIKIVPWNQIAFRDGQIAMPMECSIAGKKIQEIFGTSGITAEDAAANGIDLSQPSNGVSESYNNYFTTEQVKKKADRPENQIAIVFDKSIGQANLLPAGIGSTNVSRAMPAPNTVKNGKSVPQIAGGADKSQLNWNGVTENIPAKTYINNIIADVLVNSTYYTEQIKPYDHDSDAPSQPNTTVNQTQQVLSHFRIISKVEITGYNTATNKYTIKTTLYVKPWLKSSSHPNGPAGRRPGYCKVYNYLYMGGYDKNTLPPTSLSNTDVINCDIKFNILFFNSSTTNKEKADYSNINSNGNPAALVDNANSPFQNPITNPWATPTPGLPYSQLGSIPTKFTSDNSCIRPMVGAGGGNRQTSIDVYNSLTKSSNGDMVSVKLEIIGDPTLIKQDDIFYNQGIPQNSSDPNALVGGSIQYDCGEIYAKLNIRSPIDYDESTGLANPALNSVQQSVFSGIYTIVTVDNVFSKGKFQQTLEMARLPIDDADRSVAAASAVRVDSVVSQNAGQGKPFPSIPNFGGLNLPSILKPIVTSSLTPAFNAAAVVAGAGSMLNSLVSQAESLLVGQAAQAATKYLTGALGLNSPYTGLSSGITVTTASATAAQNSVQLDNYELFGNQGNPLMNGADNSDLYGAGGNPLASSGSSFSDAIDSVKASISDAIDSAVESVGSVLHNTGDAISDFFS